MDKVTPDPPNAEIQSTPRTPSTMYTINPTVDIQTLLGSVSESLASASVSPWILPTEKPGQVAMPCWAFIRFSCWQSSR